jgi:protein TonB
VLGIAVLAPLLYTEALPLSALKGTFVVTAPVRSAPPAPEVHRVHPNTSNFEGARLVEPIRVPPNVNHVVDNTRPDASGDYSGPAIPGAIPDGSARNDTISHLIAITPPVTPSIRPTSVRLSGGVTEGLLIQKTKPLYPKIAIMARQQGSVILQATIGRDGSIENLHAISGPSLLIQSAIDAVKQWRYRPYLLDNQPVEVETQITVNFNLGG